MDLETVRANLPSMTRTVLGETVSIFPKVEGKMAGETADPSREAQLDRPGRFDLAPDIEQLGGGRDVPERARGISPHASVSFALADITWLPKTGDHIGRVHPHTAAAELYRIDRVLEPLPASILCTLSRLS